ncbi:MAG: DUF2306 domain-containing protein [Reyranella sp.]|nr:DUF2306 domain-containing protein [Reyranella sp.]
MTLEPILSAGSATQIHLATISAAFVIGSWMMIRPKGTRPHRALGMTYIALMTVSAVSTFWVRGIAHGGFSFLHLLSAFVLVALPFAWIMARRGRVQIHRFIMIGVYAGGIWIAGLLTLLPGRVLSKAVFGF